MGCIGVREGDDRVEATIGFQLCKTPSGVQVGGVALFPLRVVHVRKVILLIGVELFFIDALFFIVGTFILFILIELEVIVSRIVELFRDVVIVLLEVIGSVCRLRFLPAAVARRCA